MRTREGLLFSARSSFELLSLNRRAQTQWLPLEAQSKGSAMLPIPSYPFNRGYARERTLCRNKSKLALPNINRF
jgi:hypothetical protein